MKNKNLIQLMNSRKSLFPPVHNVRKEAAEGGCGVVGVVCNEKIAGKHIMQACCQMHNRGNSKGGGIAAFGLDPDQFGVSKETLEQNYLIQIAYLDPGARKEVEEEFIFSQLEVHSHSCLIPLDDFRFVKGLEVQPPGVWRYFCRVKEEDLNRFITKNNLKDLPRNKIEDEFIYQNTFKLNKKYYTSLGEKRAFVLSHGRNMFILKIVGYAEQAIQYYKLENIKAKIWIGHQRYPTKGKVWHPGGAHPFAGMDEALVHNGDFANYHSITEYLAQRNIYSLFLTDTEVSVLLFDLFNRIYNYPLEYIIEAIAPTTERDFTLLPDEKKKIYRALQSSHIHCSPDGPWFFIIGRTLVDQNSFQLIGITDTSMLRPQVFALQENGVRVGLIASEKQAIDATLRSLHEEDKRFLPYADTYWNARGGSYTDGGAFTFTVNGEDLEVTDKFGKKITTRKEHDCPLVAVSECRSRDEADISDRMAELTDVIDFRWSAPIKDRAKLVTDSENYINNLFSELVSRQKRKSSYSFINFKRKDFLSPPEGPQEILVIDCEHFPPEGPESISRFIVNAYEEGWKNFFTLNWRGQRFCGCGLGPRSDNVQIDVYGSSGDYLASGLDGASIFVHENAQDQVAQIMKRGKLVIYGDVGQTFMYGAKGGEAFVLGNAAGRPLINAVGHPRVVINGTCLDYLAESFMAGDPFKGGGFVILNGIRFNEKGEIVDLDSPYPGGNLFSLASGGAIYIRDPHQKVETSQLNGGRFTELTEKDWELILPYLKENERLFNIPIEHLLSTNENPLAFNKVYRKVEAVKLKALSKDWH